MREQRRLNILLRAFFFCVLNISALEAQEPLTFGNFTPARGVTIDPQGNIYVTDAGANKIQKYTFEGKLVTEIGGYGWGQLEFDQPAGVAATNGLDIFVADYGNHRIQRFNRKLEYIATLTTRESESEPQRFGYPTAVAVTRVGDVLVCDGENNRVLRFSKFSRFDLSIGGINAGKGRLAEPIDVEVDDTDRILVLEPKRVVVFDRFGNYLSTFGQDTLQTATGFGVSGSSVFVADGFGVLEFNRRGMLERTIDCRIFSVDKSSNCVDVAATADRLCILFPTAVLVIPRVKRD